MYARSAISQLAVLSVLTIILLSGRAEVFAQEAENATALQKYHISALESKFANNTLSIDIVGKSIPPYTVSELFAPFRVVVNVAGAVFDEGVSTTAPLIVQNPVGQMTVTTLSDQDPQVTRFEIAIADSHDYTVNRNGNNISIVIAPADEDRNERLKLNTPSVPSITDFQISKNEMETTILLSSTAPVTSYKTATLAGEGDKPARMFIDISDVSIIELLREKYVGTAVDKIRVAERGAGARIVFDSATTEIFDYDIQNTEQGLKVIVKNNLGAGTVSATGSRSSVPANADSTLDELIESSSDLLAKVKPGSSPGIPKADTVPSLQDTFAFSGYNNQRISVDFYKIDIHNVFRLFRQITDLNIIVDEGVAGTVTLALSDVPWDFALDVILNLHDLVKEERFNTIVIYPKKKAFEWPERAVDNLSFEADLQVVEQEALIIEQTATQTPELMKAKEILKVAKAADDKQNYERAVKLYEEAVELWPTNSNIHNRMATIYLVHMGMNAKAVYCAKKALEADPTNSRAALYAAIGLANMQRTGEASEYFMQAVSQEPPLKEALFSFAAFNESNNQHQAALKLINQYHKYYGETLDTMLTRARIYDKIGNSEQAVKEYSAIITSGYQLRPDLKEYIQERVAAGN
ncbi:tetratricopeptide repeat protein [Desulfosediminicola ganghwensis]|uniref:tetratricopeptide repeat protein n=1 Tax=Desulfosediminicola ganghwensis TaxID=2569540 RepID=UPI0010AD3B40|nr:tetratricopeptide repeat protein [Desulfosediminicola ganghwensis]